MTVRFMDEDSATGLLPCVRRAMFSEPLLAHPAAIGGVDATWHTHSGNDDGRDQRHDEADDEQHMVVAANQAAYRNPDTRPAECLCASAHGQHSAIRRVEAVRVCVTRGLALRTSASHPQFLTILTGGNADVCTLWSGAARFVC